MLASPGAMPVDLLLLLLLSPPLGLARAQNLPRRLHGGGGNEAASAVLGQILGCVCVYWRVKQYLRRQRAPLKATTPEKRLSATSKAEMHGKNASPKATSGIPSQ